ncbi:DR2241 family protein [Haloarchaeobius amylolyticus]|uniref:DR2241 family protein n=1 Tax=Haloarchaeobius amylolyticus TaxID=1198296 RepID=UPI0022711033|nr:DR2241 family protein [Haloarchaeobius amylolyticus]
MAVTGEATIEDDQFEALLDAVREGPIDFDGLEVRYEDDGYVFSVPDLTRKHLAEDELHRVCTANADWVTNWHYWETVVEGHDTARRAFLRKLEAAESHTVPERYAAMRDVEAHEDAHEGDLVTEWGQVHISVALGEVGYRRYEVRHEDDADADRADLAVHEDPREARELAKYDAKGRYRPLRTAPSLPGGFVFPDLTSKELLTVVDSLYPATVANWHREQQGNLDVSHWHETTERQTGIYGIVSELPREAVDWVAESCCVDSQCLKRREWHYEEDDHLDAPGGDGQFPCREPCSLVVAASRKWTKLEEEHEHTYEFDLTPSEKEQVEDIIAAVADGRIDEIREADVYEGANRYRARYLRAKRFDDHGNLCGVETGDEE